MDKKKRERFTRIYEQCFALYPDAAALPSNKLYYLHRQWIFPNHIDPVLTYIEAFHKRFYPGSNLEVALCAGLLHDAGLVYGRSSNSPSGHEERSCRFATILLQQEDYDVDFIRRVCQAIKATEPSVLPATEEAVLVRNADAYSHLSSMHFIGKAYFAEDIKSYIEWFDAKLHGSLKKLTIPDLVKEKAPTVEMYEVLLATYHRHQGKRYID